MKLLDLFCGAGGATKGYQQAGFHVTGVDIAPQPNYRGDDFHQGGVLTLGFTTVDTEHMALCRDHRCPWKFRGVSAEGTALQAEDHARRTGHRVAVWSTDSYEVWRA